MRTYEEVDVLISNLVMNVLLKEKKFLQMVIERMNKELKNAPAGSIRVKNQKNNIQFFYHDPNAKDKDETYLPVKSRKKALALVKKRYHSRLLEAAGRQQKILDRFLKKYDPQALQKVFLKEPSVRQELLLSDTVPDTLLAALLPDNLYAELWEKYEYEKKPFYEDSPVHLTNKQERVRSKSEVLIANTLYKLGIPYRYECPLQLDTGIIHPDFTILRTSDRRVFYYEHLGMMDDAGYARAAVQRLDDYERNGIYLGDQLIITSETSRLPLNSIKAERIIRHYILLE